MCLDVIRLDFLCLDMCLVIKLDQKTNWLEEELFRLAMASRVILSCSLFDLCDGVDDNVTAVMGHLTRILP